MEVDDGAPGSDKKLYEELSEEAKNLQEEINQAQARRDQWKSQISENIKEGTDEYAELIAKLKGSIATLQEKRAAFAKVQEELEKLRAGEPKSLVVYQNNVPQVLSNNIYVFERDMDARSLGQNPEAAKRLGLNINNLSGLGFQDLMEILRNPEKRVFEISDQGIIPYNQGASNLAVRVGGNVWRVTMIEQLRKQREEFLNSQLTANLELQNQADAFTNDMKRMYMEAWKAIRERNEALRNSQSALVAIEEDATNLVAKQQSLIKLAQRVEARKKELEQEVLQLGEQKGELTLNLEDARQQISRLEIEKQALEQYKNRADTKSAEITQQFAEITRLKQELEQKDERIRELEARPQSSPAPQIQPSPDTSDRPGILDLPEPPSFEPETDEDRALAAAVAALGEKSLKLPNIPGGFMGRTDMVNRIKALSSKDEIIEFVDNEMKGIEKKFEIGDKVIGDLKKKVKGLEEEKERLEEEIKKLMKEKEEELEALSKRKGEEFEALRKRKEEELEMLKKRKEEEIDTLNKRMNEEMEKLNKRKAELEDELEKCKISSVPSAAATSSSLTSSAPATTTSSSLTSSAPATSTSAPCAPSAPSSLSNVSPVNVNVDCGDDADDSEYVLSRPIRRARVPITPQLIQTVARAFLRDELLDKLDQCAPDVLDDAEATGEYLNKVTLVQLLHENNPSCMRGLLAEAGIRGNRVRTRGRRYRRRFQVLDDDEYF